MGVVQISLTTEDLIAFAKEIVRQISEPKTTPTTNENDELLTRKDVMEYLGIKGTTLWSWAKMGILTPIKIKRKCLYRKSDILALQKRPVVVDNSTKFNHN